MGTGRSQAEGEGVAEALIPKFTPNLRWRLEAIEVPIAAGFFAQPGGNFGSHRPR